MNLFIPKDVLKLGEDETAVFAEMNRQLYTSSFSKVYIGVIPLAQMWFKGDESRAKKACDSLKKKKFITKIKDGCYVITKGGYDNSSFVQILLEEYYAITNSDIANGHKISLLYHLCWIINCFNWNIDINGERNIVGNVSLPYFVERENKSVQSIKNYNKELEEMDLISVIRGGYNPTKDGRTPNYYCRSEYKKEVEKFVKGSLESNLSDIRRSVTAKFNHYVKNPDKYSPEDAWDVLKGCIKYWNLNKDKDRRGDLMIFATNGVIEDKRLNNAIKKNIERNTK